MRYIFACLFVSVLSFAAVPEAAQAGSITGAWQGDGLVKLTSGRAEKIRCRLQYEAGSGRTFVVQVTCSHANGIFRTTGRIVKLSDSRYSGRLYSEQHDVAGEVSINVNGSRQLIRAVSSKGTATVNLTRR